MSKIDLASKDWCDLVFQGRNQAYGAYQMRAQAATRNTKATIAVIVLVLAAIFLPLIVKTVIPKGSDDSMTATTDLATKVKEAEIKDQHIEKHYEPKKEQPQLIKSSIKFTAPKIAPDNEVSEADEMKSQEALSESKVSISIADVKGNDEERGKDIADIKEVITSKPQEAEQVYQVVEQMPQFPGGEEALINYIAKHLKYPSIALEQGIEGIVMVRFVVTGTGQVGEVQILRSLDPYCDREAKRVIQSLPKFIPGKQQGRPVSVWYTCPIRFQIE